MNPSFLALLLATRLMLGPGDESELGERQVSIELAHWQALHALARAEPEPTKPPGPFAATRSATLTRTDAGVRVAIEWRIDAFEGGLWTSPLIAFPGLHAQSPPLAGMRVEKVRFEGRELGITSTAAGEEVTLELADRSSGTLELVAFVPSESLPDAAAGELELWLMPAVRGELRVEGLPTPEGQVAELVVEGQPRRELEGAFWAGEGALRLHYVDASARSDAPEQPLALAQTALGLTFGAGEVRGRARVSWLLRRGQLDTVSIDASGLGDDLELAGPNVQAWTRTGDRIDIELKAAVDDRIDVDLRWSRALSSEAETRVSVPRLVAGQAYRSESFLQIARDDDLEVLPQLDGWSTLARVELPEWASGYVQGTATASFQHERDDPNARFDVLRFVPVSGPPVMVDVAAYEIATTQEGRSLVQARYDVRNERASHLAIELPSGTQLLGATVDGEAVTPSREAGTSARADTWRIPLVRSLESVKGSLSFPVEILYLGDGPAWDKKEARDLQLPALDAPVAVSRVTVHLPPKYRNRVDVGDHHRVNAFSEGEGITYGLGVGADRNALAQADELYRSAVDGWMANDFQRAQSSLDELARLGASNENIAGLQANLDLVQGRDEGENDKESSGQSAVVSRRIKDQAKIRSTDDKRKLVEKTEEAEQLEAKGDYDEAEQKLAEAQAIGERLAMLEQDESKEQVAYNQSLSSSSSRVAEKKKAKVGRETAATKNERKDEQQRFSFGKLGGKGAAPVDMAGTELAEFDAKVPISGTDTAAGDPGPRAEPIQEYVVDGANITTGATVEIPVAVTQSAGVTIDREYLDAVPVTRSSGAMLEVADKPADVVSVVQSMPGVARKRKGRGPNKPSNAPARGRDQAAPAPATMPTTTTTTTTADPNEALAGPVATASAVTIHVPAIGEAVHYQYMLQPEGKAPIVHLEARRHNHKSKRRSKP